MGTTLKPCSIRPRREREPELCRGVGHPTAVAGSRPSGRLIQCVNRLNRDLHRPIQATGWKGLSTPKKRQPACKPGSVWPRRLSAPRRGGHSSWTRVATRLMQPTRTAGRKLPRELPLLPSLFGFAPGVVCRAAPVARRAVGSYPTLSPLPRRSPKATAGGLLSVALSLGSPPPDVIRHRISMEPGLSSPAAFRLSRVRPPGRLAGAIKAFVAKNATENPYRSRIQAAPRRCFTFEQ
jgi:hypothetical protein